MSGGNNSKQPRKDGMREAQSWRDTARRGVTRYNLFRDSDLPSSWRDTAGREGGGGRIGIDVYDLKCPNTDTIMN